MRPGGGAVPEARIRAAGPDARPDGRHVLYWMIATRRPRWNYALDRAIAHARSLDRPLLVLEALSCDYRWASDRLHAFALDGMRDNAAAFAGTPVAYRAYVEPEPDAGSGLVDRLAADACVVVTDDFPCFSLPHMVDRLESRIGTRLERVDSNGLFPMRATGHVYRRAYDFRRELQESLLTHLDAPPAREPLSGLGIPEGSFDPEVLDRWPHLHDTDGLERVDPSSLPIDHDVTPVDIAGGHRAGSERARTFVGDELDAYAEDRRHPDADAGSGLSPWLHWGHVSAHEVFDRIIRREGWEPDRTGEADGSREGWWGMSDAAESFLDELVTWRELGFNRCALTDDYDRYESLPEWARETLAEHADDERPDVYPPAAFEAAETHDGVWNAAQRQLLREGRIHNYMRMLWGKKILEWTERPADALEIMIELNNKYAVDGRDPNSYSGIFWVLGRYDRAWGPERPIYGKIRYMTSKSTRRKLRVGEYLERYGP